MSKLLSSAFTCLLLAGLCSTPGYAQLKKNLPKAFKKAAQTSSAFQEALRHAQAARLATVQKQVTTPPSVTQATEDLISRAVARKATSRRNAPKKTSEQWVAELDAFIAQKGRFPTSANEEERQLLQGVLNTKIRLGPKSPLTQHILQLRAQYPTKKPGHPPTYWLEKLEIFVQENGHYPKQNALEEEKELHISINSIVGRLLSKDPIVVRIRQIQAQYATPSQKNPPAYWLEKLETFVQENNHYPKQNAPEEEKTLRIALDSILARLLPEDPIAKRIREIHLQYPNQTPRYPNTVRLEQLEDFVQKNGYFPRYNSTGEERTLYLSALGMLTRLPIRNPIAKRIRELQADPTSAQKP